MSIYRDDGTIINDPLVYEWVFWFEDGNIISNFSNYGQEIEYKNVIDYATRVSPVKRFGFVPFSPEKRKAINKMHQENITESYPIGTHYIEFSGNSFDKIYIRKRKKYTQPIGALAPPPSIDTFYILGVISKDKHGLFLAIDKFGNCRVDNHMDVIVPIIPPEIADIKEIEGVKNI